MNNTVILNKDASTWPRIKKYWEEVGVDRMLIPTYGNEGTYYGLVNGIFGGFLLQQVKSNKAEIIELPEEPKEEKKYPRVMWVWMKGYEENKVVKLIDFEMDGDFFHYVGNKTYKAFDHASVIEPEIEATLEETTSKNKQENKYPEYPKPILRKAFELICQLKTERLQRAGCSDMEVLTYINADKDLKEIESHLNK